MRRLKSEELPLEEKSAQQMGYIFCLLGQGAVVLSAIIYLPLPVLGLMVIANVFLGYHLIRRFTEQMDRTRSTRYVQIMIARALSGITHPPAKEESEFDLTRLTRLDLALFAGSLIVVVLILLASAFAVKYYS